MGKVADSTKVYENPATPGTGIIVAAGDEIPAYAGGYIENTPNKVDAAHNHDVADAADQAKGPRIPDGVRIDSLSPEEQARYREAAARVAANRAEYDQELRARMDPQGWLPEDAFRATAPGSSAPPEPTSGSDGGQADDAATASKSSLSELTGAQLDELADALGDGLEGYKKSASKADKVKALSGKVAQSRVDALKAD